MKIWKIPSNYEGYDVKPSVVGKITALICQYGI